MLASIATAGGWLISGLYRDNAFVTTAWLANDTITLLVAVPFLSRLAQKFSGLF